MIDEKREEVKKKLTLNTTIATDSKFQQHINVKITNAADAERNYGELWSINSRQIKTGVDQDEKK